MVDSYRRDHGKALREMSVLTLEERGAYDTILNLWLLFDGNLIDDIRFLSGYMLVDVRVGRRLRSQLIEKGFLVPRDGRLAVVEAKMPIWTVANRRQVRGALRMAVWRASNCRCYLCHRLLNFRTFTVDHIKPWSRGGKSVLENLAVCCLRCNTSKGAR